MAKILCAFSSVEFTCEHLPFALSSREVSHPLFHVSKKKLLGLAGQWSNGKLTPTESYLTYLSLLHSTGLIEWRTPAQYTDKTSSIVANNMEQLIHIVGKIDVIKHPSFVLPHFAISPDTANLENSFNWIQIWNQNFNDWIENIKDHSNDQELQRRELSLQKLIKTSHKSIEDYPKILAAWAVTAGDFPTFDIKINGVKMELGEYWETIIIKCAKEETVFQVPENDLRELIEHCEDNIVAEGSIYANALMKYLRKGAAMQKNYLGLGDIDLASQIGTAYRILSPKTNAEDANLQNMIDTAPVREPMKHMYPDLISYIKAKGRWTIAQNYNNLQKLQAETNSLGIQNGNNDNSIDNI
jgi:hypothetical protein